MIHHRSTLGEVLNLHPQHHFYSFPLNTIGSYQEHPFIILFEEAEQVYLVSQSNPDGFSDQLSQATRFDLDHLLDGLSYVPLPLLASCQLLALPFSEKLHLKELQASYPTLSSLKKLTEETESPSLYNPYRHAHEGLAYDQQQTTYQLIASDRDYDKELHAFDRISRGPHKGDVKAITMSYWDDNLQQTVNLAVRGWYLFDNEPPLQISWKPAHHRKARWRTSHVFIDKASDEYFFSGELYHDKQTPIFLKHLSFANQSPSQTLQERWQTFLKLMDEQKKTYLLKSK